MRWAVIFHPEVAAWLRVLDDDTYQQVIAALRELRDQGPALGRPLADTVRGSRHKNMKELRPGSAGRSEIRILFAFDLERQAVLLVAGDKAGRWQRWYRRAISIADDRFDEHIEMLRKREHHG
ncbi:MAG: type II toxin-antitoxin system RelE/ParE family toxin [Trebonia sp.]